MANLITLSRLILLGIAVVIIYEGTPLAHLGNVLVLILVFVSDGLDGYVARRRNETSLFGALFDVAADRIVELSLWVVFAHVGAVPIWIPLIYIARGIMTDTIRAYESRNHGQSPFAMMQSPLGKAIVAGRFMRGFYAVLKAVTFCVLMLTLPLPELSPTLWREYGTAVTVIAQVLTYSCLLICLLRGAPVIIEFLHRSRPAA